MVGDGQASDVIWGSSLVSGQSRRVGVVDVGVVMECPKDLPGPKRTPAPF